MKKNAVILAFAFVAGCATAPQNQLKPVNSYAAMSCSELQAEYISILEHEKYHEDTQSESNMFSVVGVVLGVAAGVAGIDMAGNDQPTEEINAIAASSLEQASLNSSEADSAKAKKEEMSVRKTKMTQLMNILECDIPVLAQ